MYAYCHPGSVCAPQRHAFNDPKEFLRKLSGGVVTFPTPTVSFNGLNREGATILHVAYATGPRFGSMTSHGHISRCLPLVGYHFPGQRHNSQPNKGNMLSVYEECLFSGSQYTMTTTVLMAYGVGPRAGSHGYLQET